MSPCMYFFDTIGGHYSAQGVRKLVKINRYTTFMHFLYISTPHKLEMNTFSGRIKLWKPLGGYEPLYVLL